MILSIFTDETGMDLEKAIPLVKSWGLHYIDLRSRIFQRPLEKLTDRQLEEVKKLLDDNGLKVACLEDIALRSGWITPDHLRETARPMSKNQYGQYLLRIANEEEQKQKLARKHHGK